MKKISFTLLLFLIASFSVNLKAQDVAFPATCNNNSFMEYTHNSWPTSSFIGLDFCFSYDGPNASSPFFIGFYLSSDILIDTSDYFIGEYLITNLAATFGGPDFYDFQWDFGGYFIDSIDFMSGIPHGVTLYGGAILDHTYVYSETDETNNVFLFSGTGMKILSVVGRDELVDQSSPVQVIYNFESKELILKFQNLSSSNVELEILNLAGQSLTKEVLGGQAKMVRDLTGFHSGIYLARVTIGEKVYSYKLAVL